MGKHVKHSNRGACLKPTSMALLSKPLEFIHEDHLRERQICVLIDEIAQGDTPGIDVLSSVLGFLTKELPLHLQDEEEDLFPLLRRRCEPEDNIDRLISKLHSDHAHADDDTPKIVSLLDDLANTSRALTQSERDMLSTYAMHARRHLILENAIILPFARHRLTDRDLESLCIRMCQRRGVESPKERFNAERPT